MISTRTSLLFGVAITICAGHVVHGRDFRPNLIPNGTVFSCANCHFNRNGGGPRNPFGQAVEQRLSFVGESFWTQTPAGMQPLAFLDSDGDGFTNGEELGDPDGDSRNVGPASLVTNPGSASSKPNSAPAFTSSPITEASVGAAYSYQATATDPDGNALTFSKVSGPAWLAVSAGGLVSGTPTEDTVGDNPVTIQVTDNGSPNLSADQAFTITVMAPDPGPSFTSWQMLNFDLPAEETQAGPAQDPDGDGLPNLVEYALRSEPKLATEVRLMSDLRFNASGQLEFSQEFRDDDPKLSITWELGSELPLNEPMAVEAMITDPVPDDGVQTWTFTDPVLRDAAGARFGRLRFEILP